MATLKPKKKCKEEVEEPEVVETTTKMTIPEDKLKKFVGPVENLLKIDAINVYDNRFRVNVWTRTWVGDSVVPRNKIEKSFFVKYDKEIVDLTIRDTPVNFLKGNQC